MWSVGTVEAAMNFGIRSAGHLFTTGVSNILNIQVCKTLHIMYLIRIPP